MNDVNKYIHALSSLKNSSNIGIIEFRINIPATEKGCLIIDVDNHANAAFIIGNNICKNVVIAMLVFAGFDIYIDVQEDRNNLWMLPIQWTHFDPTQITDKCPTANARILWSSEFFENPEQMFKELNPFVIKSINEMQNEENPKNDLRITQLDQAKNVLEKLFHQLHQPST